MFFNSAGERDLGGDYMGQNQADEALYDCLKEYNFREIKSGLELVSRGGRSREAAFRQLALLFQALRRA